MTTLRRALFTLLLLLPLLGGAIYATATSLEPAASWSEEPAAAPSGTDLVPARRAAGEAASQAGLLQGGTKSLADGATKLADGTNQLSTGSSEALTGANELSKGMVELQAGTGQLGDGAVKVADGVAKAVEQVQGVGLVQGQIIAEIDKVDAELAKKNDPQTADFRKQLAEFRKQVESFKFDGGTVDQLAELRSGSREIANQLAVPGYGYHDGIYSATKGAKELAAGLAELDKGIAEASAGAGSLRDGATKVDGMAGTTKDKVSAVQRALPVDQTATATGPMLVPLMGFLVATIVMAGSVFSNRWRWLIAVALGALALLILVNGLSAGVAIGLVGIVALGGLASALLSNALVRLLGDRWGRTCVISWLLLQVGVVGWAWKSASGASLSAAWSALSHLMPIHYATSGLTALGNGGSAMVLGLSLGVLALLAGLSALVLKVVPTRES